MIKSITLIGTLPPIKGISPYCLELLKSLSENISVEFIGFRSLYPGFLYPGKIKIIDSNYKTPEIQNAKIRNILTYYNPLTWIWAGLSAKGRIVHVQWWSYFLAPVYLTILLICKARRKKVIITVHNVFPHEKSRLNNFFNKIIIPLGDRFIVHNLKNKESISLAYKVPDGKISVIPHGILQPVPIKGVSKDEARKWLGIPQDKKLVLHFGIIRDYKGLDVLLKALALISRQMKNVSLLIAGECWGGFQKYDEIIRNNQLEDYVIKKLNFIPPSETEYYFSAANIIALPYKYFDAQSGIGAMALSFKTPLLVTRVGGLPDFVRDERAIAQANDPLELARRIADILNEENLQAKLQLDSKYIAEEYTWDKIAHNTRKLYQDLMVTSEGVKHSNACWHYKL